MVEASKKVYDFKVRPDDIWIMTFPKCGTTWTQVSLFHKGYRIGQLNFMSFAHIQELVWQIVNFDFEKARKVSLYERSPFLEIQGLASNDMLQSRAESKGVTQDDEKMKEIASSWTKSIEIAENTPSPRVIKTHLPLEMLPPNLLDTCKVIFVCRNPKDACVSFYNHFLTLPEYKMKGSFADFAALYMEGQVEFGNYWTMLKVIQMVIYVSNDN